MENEKHDYEHHIVDPEMYDDMVAFITPEAMEEAVFTDDKQTREANIRAIEGKIRRKIAENEEWLAQIGEAVYAFQKKTVRKMIFKKITNVQMVVISNRSVHFTQKLTACQEFTDLHYSREDRLRL